LNGVSVYRLDESPLQSALATETLKASLEIVLDLPDSGNIATERAFTGSASFLVIDPEIRVISQEIKLVTERFDNCAG